jgi:hypothetical protein
MDQKVKKNYRSPSVILKNQSLVLVLGAVQQIFSQHIRILHQKNFPRMIYWNTIL